MSTIDPTIREDVHTIMSAMEKALGMVDIAMGAGYGKNPKYDSISDVLEIAAEKIRIIADLWEKNENDFCEDKADSNKYDLFHASTLNAEAYLKLLAHYEWDKKVDHGCLIELSKGLVNQLWIDVENLIPRKFLKGINL